MLGFLTSLSQVIYSDNPISMWWNAHKHPHDAARQNLLANRENEKNLVKGDRFEKLRLDAEERARAVKNVNNNNIYYAPPWSVTQGSGNKMSMGEKATAYKVLYIAYDYDWKDGKRGTVDREFGKPVASFVFPLPPGITDTVTTEWSTEAGMFKKLAAGGWTGGKIGDSLAKHMRNTFGNLSKETVGFQHEDFFFQSVGLRDFTFGHKLVPQSIEESQEMKRIIDRIQYQSLPTKHGAATLIRPSDWEIHFLDGDGGINEFLPKINRCILESVNINNTPNENFQPSRNKYPNDIEIELVFKEQVIRTRADYMDKSDKFAEAEGRI